MSLHRICFSAIVHICLAEGVVAVDTIFFVMQ